MIRLEQSVDVRRDAQDIFDFLSAIERYPDWLPGVIEAKQTSDGPVGPATTFSLRIAGPAGPIDAAGEVTEVDPPHRLAIRGDAQPGTVGGGFELAASEAATATRIRIWMEIELRGAYRFAEGLVARELEASLPGVLDRLRVRLEDVQHQGDSERTRMNQPRSK